MPLRNRFSIILLALALGACATGPRQAGSPATAGASGGDVESNGLYARLDQDSKRYADGLDLARTGNTVEAQAAMKGALDDLRAAATRCGQLAGCDQQRFIAVFDNLLRLGIGGRSDQAAEGDTAGATPEATTQSGETSPATAALPELGRSVTLLKGRELGDIIALNGPVKAALEEWLTQYRPNLMDAYENYQYLRYRMWPEYEKAGLPEALLFGMLAKESGGKVHAVSRSGASGPLQFMYATGLRFGLGSVDGFDQRFDPQLAARANAAYINEQLAIFNNNLELVIGAYNGGEGAMQRRAGRGAAAMSFWSPEVYYGVSQETREYVPMVLAAAWLFMHPERYNVDFPKIPGHPGNITLKRAASIAELTVCLGQDGNLHDGWFRTLRNLNPRLDPQQQQPAGTRLVVPLRIEKSYQRDCAIGRWADLAAELHAAALPAPPPVALAQRAAPPPKPRIKTYTVRKGDTLASIARHTNCGGIREIAAANGLRAPHYALKPGQVLKLTGC
ncbi:MAG: transglycosylase SLT domain-containing protein [Lysobacterales bacterium]